MEGPDPEMQEDGNKKESSWEFIREWFGLQKSFGAGSNFASNASLYGGNGVPAKSGDLSLLLGVLGCPLAPIPLATTEEPVHPLHIKDIPNVVSSFFVTRLAILKYKYVEKRVLRRVFGLGRRFRPTLNLDLHDIHCDGTALSRHDNSMVLELGLGLTVK